MKTDKAQKKRSHLIVHEVTPGARMESKVGSICGTGRCGAGNERTRELWTGKWRINTEIKVMMSYIYSNVTPF